MVGILVFGAMCFDPGGRAWTVEAERAKRPMTARMEGVLDIVEYLLRDIESTARMRQRTTVFAEECDREHGGGSGSRYTFIWQLGWRPRCEEAGLGWRHKTLHLAVETPPACACRLNGPEPHAGIELWPVVFRITPGSSSGAPKYSDSRRLHI